MKYPLVVHAFYRSRIPSGENTTVLQILEMVADIAGDANEYFTHSDELLDNRFKKFREFLRHISFKANPRLIRSSSQASVIQIHNPFPALTFADLRFIESSSIPVIRVIHNYRKSCIKGTNFRNGSNCFKCTTKYSFSALRFSCYNNSVLESAFVEFYRIMLQRWERRLIQKKMIRYIAISPSVATYLSKQEVPSDIVTVIPNFVPSRAPIENISNQVLFVGRNSPEKGLEKLIDYWQLHKSLPQLFIVGDTENLTSRIKDSQNITLFPNLGLEELERVARSCLFAIFPTQWEEPFGKTLIEAMYRNQIIISTPNGLPSELLQDSPLCHFLNDDWSNIHDLIKVPDEKLYNKYTNFLKDTLGNQFQITEIKDQWKRELQLDR